MKASAHLMDMLVGYAAAHQNPFNIIVHLIGIPVIMFGLAIALSWVSAGADVLSINLAYVLVLGLFAYYFTLDKLFALAFLAYAMLIAVFATRVGLQPLAESGVIAAAAFFGGYLAQFIGHAVEKSIPVVLKHPIQAHIAAPFFVVVDVFKIIGLRPQLFDAVQREIAVQRESQPA